MFARSRGVRDNLVLAVIACSLSCSSVDEKTGDDAPDPSNETPELASLNFESRVLNADGEQWEFYYTIPVEIRGTIRDSPCSGPFRIYLDHDSEGGLEVVVTEREYCEGPRDIGDRRYKIDSDGKLLNHNLAATTEFSNGLTENELFIRSEGTCVHEFHVQIDENDEGTLRDTKSSDCDGVDAHEAEIRPYVGD